MWLGELKWININVICIDCRLRSVLCLRQRIRIMVILHVDLVASKNTLFHFHEICLYFVCTAGRSRARRVWEMCQAEKNVPSWPGTGKKNNQNQSETNMHTGEKKNNKKLFVHFHMKCGEGIGKWVASPRLAVNLSACENEIEMIPC